MAPMTSPTAAAEMKSGMIKADATENPPSNADERYERFVPRHAAALIVVARAVIIVLVAALIALLVWWASEGCGSSCGDRQERS